MGSLGGINGSASANLLRLQAELKALQAKPGAAAALNAGSSEAIEEDVLISTVLDVGAPAETNAEQEDARQVLAQARPEYVPTPVAAGQMAGAAQARSRRAGYAVQTPPEAEDLEGLGPGPGPVPQPKLRTFWLLLAVLGAAAALLIWRG